MSHCVSVYMSVCLVFSISHSLSLCLTKHSLVFPHNEQQKTYFVCLHSNCCLMLEDTKNKILCMQILIKLMNCCVPVCSLTHFAHKLTNSLTHITTPKHCLHNSLFIQKKKIFEVCWRCRGLCVMKNLILSKWKKNSFIFKMGKNYFFLFVQWQTNKCLICLQ